MERSALRNTINFNVDPPFAAVKRTDRPAPQGEPRQIRLFSGYTKQVPESIRAATAGIRLFSGYTKQVPESRPFLRSIAGEVVVKSR